MSRTIIQNSDQGPTGGGRSIVTLEDPVEAVVTGAVQSQINPTTGFEMATGLRSLLRQDPEVILIGEIRDHETAEIAIQAALTGQLVITTFHAGSCAEAVHRLIDMGISTYAIRNAVRLIVSQRLLRNLCDCARPNEPAADVLPLEIDIANYRMPMGCADCRQTGYYGRSLIAETLSLQDPIMQSRLSSSSPPKDLSTVAGESGHGNLIDCAQNLVAEGITSPAEVVRALGVFS